MRTPAQASGQPNFVTDVPVQGPTDPGIREADCRWAEARNLHNPSCVDCGDGPIPNWARQSIPHGVSEQISLGGTRVYGFGVAASSTSMWDRLTTDQQAWVASTLTRFNQLFYADGRDQDCPGGPNILNASRCFQRAFNAQIDDALSRGFVPAYNGVALNKLNTFGEFDTDTLCALISAAKAKSMAPPPDTLLSYCAGPLPAPLASDKTLSTGTMVGIATVGVAALGGIIYAATRSARKSRRTRRR